MLKSNPIFFKDLLISLNSKTGKSIIIFFTLIYFIVFLFVVADYKSNTFSSDAGATVFSAIGTMQLIVLCFIGYIKGLLSISNEKDKNTLEFIMITKITSWQFIIGKFLSNFFYIFLLALISLPFLGIGLVLGGVNIQDILLYFLYSTSYISVAILLGMVLSSISKNNIFSVIYGASAIGIFFTIMALIVYNIEYINIQESMSAEAFGYALFPVFLFDGIRNYKMLNLFGIDINFTILHIMLYGLVIGFFLQFLYSKFKQYTNPSNKAYYYIGTAILFLLFLLISKISTDGGFLFVFFFLVTTYLIYLLSENSFINGKYKDNYIYFAIVLTISLCSMVVLNEFSLGLSLLFISIFAVFFTFYEALIKLIKQGKGIINLFFVIGLAMIFYVIPAISTQFLEMNFKNPTQLIKATVKQEKIIDYRCDNKITTYSYHNTCDGNLDTNVMYYIIYYIVLSIIFFGLGSFKKISTKPENIEMKY